MQKRNREEHIQQVHEWLKENVITYDEVTSLVLFGFDCEADDFGGSFKVKVNGEKRAHEFKFYLGGASGEAAIGGPVFHSPLGAPCSYGALEIPHEATRAIERAIRELFPRMRPFGLNRHTGVKTEMGTPNWDRLPDRKQYLRTVEKISEPGFELVVKVDL